jgi:hypothetical protein
MKSKVFFMLLALGVMAITPMIYMGKFNPLAILGPGFSMKSSASQNLKASAPKNLSSVVTDEKVEVYKWRDENGVMQFSNTPPPSDSKAEKVVLDPNSNLMQAVKIPVKEAPEEKEVVQTKSQSPYSPKAMKKVMDDVKNVEKLMQQRQEKQQEALNNL